mmetsp:Transcript_67573/g.98813  ORF Transcript_67573/g.98813 Transcript_67573/m.98813 type:complete len:363 (-) Transcript_67573:80-1168(-)|eukprot:CAMPEP_0173096978 /NCGR_PEP_ID=MMETSP1102-20130122/33438_1 /TAXON_ID=49646 /ORGANISM="Geminigera sp., Strain Caron Lab Isolate" /LENGTH=362 /DNA_ID=CAMNT_0013988349 /DNA_START=107 /DNA_END=1195 /DNA_ORIENTATION=+
MGGIICSCAGAGDHVGKHDYSDDEDSLNWHMGNLGVCQFEAHFVPGRTLGTGSYGRVRIAQFKKNGYFYAVKILSKDEMIRLRQVEHVKEEKNIMEKASAHPSLIALAGSFQDSHHLHLVLELAHGGELFRYLRRVERFSVETARFYAAQVILGLAHLHSYRIVYRDLKPENLMLDRSGNCKITDFGFAKVVQDRTWTMLGTPEYVAPEIIRSEGYSFSVDWWAMGILLYELLVGWPPFIDDNPMLLFKKILKARLGYPQDMPKAARRCIREFLQPDRSKRLGNINGGVRLVKEHAFFHGLDWDALENLQITAPYLPHIASDSDDAHFQIYDEEKGPSAGHTTNKSHRKELCSADNDLFKDF